MLWLIYAADLALVAWRLPPQAQDPALYAATGFMSGHTLKHLLAALGVAGLAWMLARRKDVSGAKT